MKSNQPTIICAWCEKEKSEENSQALYEIGRVCEQCIDENYENKTGYCSAMCCMSGSCDQSC